MIAAADVRLRAQPAALGRVVEQATDMLAATAGREGGCLAIDGRDTEDTSAVSQAVQVAGLIMPRGRLLAPSLSFLFLHVHPAIGKMLQWPFPSCPQA